MADAYEEKSEKSERWNAGGLGPVAGGKSYQTLGQALARAGRAHLAVGAAVVETATLAGERQPFGAAAIVEGEEAAFAAQADGFEPALSERMHARRVPVASVALHAQQGAEHAIGKQSTGRLHRQRPNVTPLRMQPSPAFGDLAGDAPQPVILRAEPRRMRRDAKPVDTARLGALG